MDRSKDYEVDLAFQTLPKAFKRQVRSIYSLNQARSNCSKCQYAALFK